MGKRAAGGVQRKPAVRKKPAASDARAGPAVEQRAHKPGAVVSRGVRAVGWQLRNDKPAMRIWSVGGGVDALPFAMHLLGIAQPTIEVSVEPNLDAAHFQVRCASHNHVYHRPEDLTPGSKAPCCKHAGQLCQLPFSKPDALVGVVADWKEAKDDDDQSVGARLMCAIRRSAATYFVFVVQCNAPGCLTNMTDALGDAYSVAMQPSVSLALSGAPLGGASAFVFGASKRAATDAAAVARSFVAMLQHCPNTVSHYDQIRSERPPSRKPAQPFDPDTSAIYWGTIKAGIAAAKTTGLWRDGVHALPAAGERTSEHMAAVRVSGKQQAHGDLFQALIGEGAICDISKTPVAATCKLAQVVGMLPPLLKSSMPWSMSHREIVSPADILAMKGITHTPQLNEFSSSDAMTLACTAPSAILIAFALAAIASATGHAM